MSYYRDTYLKSEHWKNLRCAKLAATQAKCNICGVQSPSNDVHHIDYRGSLWDVQPSDLRVLCREHHDEIHRIMDALPASESIPTRLKWNRAYGVICKAIVDKKRAEKADRKLKYLDQLNAEWSPLFQWAASVRSPWAVNFIVFILEGIFLKGLGDHKKHCEDMRAKRVSMLLASKTMTVGDRVWLDGQLGRQIFASAHPTLLSAQAVDQLAELLERRK